MNYSYDESYLPLSQRILGDMYDYAVNTLSFEMKQYHRMFIVSGVAKQFEIGNPTYVAGMNGCEVAREVISSCTDRTPENEDIMYLDKSPEYWVGWALAYYQWKSAFSFREIDLAVPIEEVYGMYSPLHEADVSVFAEIMDEKMRELKGGAMLKRLRMYSGLSQKMLADRSGVALRQIQLFEQGQRDIRKCGGTTLLQLSRALGCSMEELMIGI